MPTGRTMFEKIWSRHVVAEGPFLKECLLRGQDEIALTLGYEEAIRAFEESHRREMPWLVPHAGGG